jgi:hypothetical protein
MKIQTKRIAVLGALLLLVTSGELKAQDPIDWEPFSDEQRVQVVTTNQDGSTRETTVWLVVVDGLGHIRTGNTRWGGNVERNPDIVLRVQEAELTVRAEFVTDPSEREKVAAAFREKYGIWDRIMDPLRGRVPKIMRLVPRAGS